jgi:hypothetical protein
VTWSGLAKGLNPQRCPGESATPAEHQLRMITRIGWQSRMDEVLGVLPDAGSSSGEHSG